VVVLGVHYWESEGEAPAEYLAMLASLAQAASRVFVVGVATGNAPDNDPLRAGYLARNKQMRTFVEEQGHPFEYVDFDALSTAPEPKPAGPLGRDKHWMCKIGWNLQTASKFTLDTSRRGANTDWQPLPQIYAPKIERLVTTADGHCTDEVNRNLWQLILNVMLPTK